MNHPIPKGKIARYIVAVLLGALGTWAFLSASRHPVIRSLGMALIVISAYLFKAFGKYTPPAPRAGPSPDHPTSASPKSPNGSGILAWRLGLIALASLIISYLLLRRDAINGGHQAWPADAFAASALFCAATWSYLLAKSISK